MIDTEEEVRGVVAVRIAVKTSYAVRTGRLQVGPQLYYPDCDAWAEAPQKTREALEPYIRGSESHWKKLEVEEPTWGAILHAIEQELACKELKTLRGVTATQTGRLSSIQPNLASKPMSEAERVEARKIFDLLSSFKLLELWHSLTPDRRDVLERGLREAAAREHQTHDWTEGLSSSLQETVRLARAEKLMECIAPPQQMQFIQILSEVTKSKRARPIRRIFAATKYP